MSVESKRVYVPRDVAAAGSTRELCEQFVLSRSLDTPDGFETDRLGSWRLDHHPTLPVIAIDDERGNRLGWLLGYPITTDGRLLGAGSSITVQTDPVTFVGELGGRYLAIFVDHPTPGIYPDAAASYSSVYCPSLQVAASTPGLIPYDTGTTDRMDLVRDLQVPQTTSVYPYGLTPRHGIDRLLPNHHLDLDHWDMVRHGPKWLQRGSVSIEHSAARIAELTRRNMTAVMDQHLCYLPLTSGNDSRTLLACAHDRATELALYTMKIPDRNGARDAYVAAQIARHIGLPHQRVSMLRPTPDDLERWAYRTSCSVGEPRGWNATTTYRSLDRARVRFVGQVGDLSRMVNLTPDDTENTAISPERLAIQGVTYCDGADYRSQLTAAQLRAAAAPAVLERAEGWMRNSNAPDSLALLDLVYSENRTASWAGVWAYAEYFGPGFTIFPMNHHEIIELMVALPTQLRRDETFMQEVIRQQWPELLDWPFNTAPRLLGIVDFPRRVARNARRRVTVALHRR